MILKFATATSAAVLMGAGHLAQTRWGMIFAPSEWNAETGLVLTILGISLLYRTLSSIDKTYICIGLAGLSGFVYYLITLHWIGESLSLDHSAYAWISLWGSIGITFVFFPWWIAAIALFRLINMENDTSGLNPLIFAACFSLADIALGDVIYGIPLAVPGTAGMGTFLEPAYSVIGLHGFTFLLVWICAEITRTIRNRAPGRQTVFCLLAITCSVLIAPLAASRSAPSTIKLAVVQNNAPVPTGFTGADFTTSTINKNIHAIRTAFSDGAEIVVLPEGAFLDDLTTDTGLLARLAAEIPTGRFLIAGSRQYEISGEISSGLDVKTFNVAHILSDTGIIQSYRKSHLVLFGEYMPWMFRIMGFDVLGGPPGGMSAGSGLSPIRMGGHPPVLITICFEGVLSGAVQRAAEDSTWMINLSNETLFGTTAGPELINQYHRLRSIELGLPNARSVTTSYSGFIDDSGTQSKLARSETYAVILDDFETSSHNTVFRKSGYLPLYLVLIAVFTFSVIKRKQKNARAKHKLQRL